jgi:type I restriction enzyme R subunit
MITEDQLEQECLSWFREIGYQIKHGTDIAPETSQAERSDFRQVILQSRLSDALYKLNPAVPSHVIDAAVTQITNPNIPGLLSANRQLHKWITQGYPVKFMVDNVERGIRLSLIDFHNPDNNDWLAVNQFAIQGGKHNRRPDVITFVNGLPLAVIELKNPADEKADIWAAYRQLQTYKNDIPDLFTYNTLLVISDGTNARCGSVSADQERFLRWRTINGENDLDPLGNNRDLETVVRGLFRKDFFIEYLRYFCLFEDDHTIVKKIAAYHQFHAVRTAISTILKASKPDGDKKGGVIWHTQGAGKSIEMACLSGMLLSNKELGNPTLVIVTDRQDLDGQLFGVFASAGDLLGETPQQANSRKDLRELLGNRPSGGIVFTTIQKFAPEPNEGQFPVLTNRDNVVVICDEAHRTQYGFTGHIDSKTGSIKYGLAKSLRDALPRATFLAFTGTPISLDDRDTRAVFGDYVSIYDIQQAVDDGATVPIYYESRLAKLVLDDAMVATLDDQVDELFEDEDDISNQERAKSRWAALEAMVGSQPRIEQIAADLIEHYSQRSATQPGKALFVAMSRDICVRLYDAIVQLKPEWHSDNHMEGAIKVVMTASASDEQYLQPHHTNGQQKKDLEKRFKDPSDSLKLVIVRDMWLTGFDAPCLATMYVDKPMKGANLAQAIARVNRVFKDKPGGLVVDYIGIAPQLKEALATYSASNGKGQPTLNASQAFEILLEKLGVARDLLHGVSWSDFRNSALRLLPACMDHILELNDGKKRYCDAVLSITKAYALCSTLDEAAELRDEVAFLQAVRGALIKESAEDPTARGEGIDYQLQQLVSQALVADGVNDIFALAGLEKPDISILSDDFLAEVKKMPLKNLAVELLQRLLKDQVKSKFSTNVVKQRQFSELLQEALNKYTNRSIEAAQVIEELINLAKKFTEEHALAESLGLNQAEKSFYDALADNTSAKDLMADELLVEIAKELADKLRRSITVDWAVRDSVRAKLRLMVKAVLKRYKYPPDQQVVATELVLTQAESLAEIWAV